MQNETVPTHKSGFVTVVGRPNVGKSTLINAFLQQKVAAVSPRPQTTRRRQLGILTLANAQIIFIDTPGLHKPVHKLGEYMNQVAAETLGDADVVVWMVDAGQPPNEEDRLVAERLAAISHRGPVILGLNKVDRLDKEALEARRAEYVALLPGAEPFDLSAASGYNRQELLERIIHLLPEGPVFYDEDQITDLYERDITADLIRQAALVHLREEVPHSIAVRVDEFKERGETGAFIRATVFVERDSHKGIIIGKGGEMLKKIGAAARKEIEEMSGRKVFLELNVKVNKNWRDNVDALRLFGYFEEDDEDR
ncbi:MAG TPA: GTPase Era [Anaerolineaceae bacterium]